MPRSPRRSPPGMPLTLLLSATLAACAHPTPTAAIDQAAANPPPAAVCAVFKTISFDRLNDTLPTIQQVKASNARRAALCGAAASDGP
jgi:hypothetical protein